MNAIYKLLILLVTLAIVAKIFGFIGTWRDVPLWVMIQVFLLSGVGHFTKLKHEFVKMIPAFVPWKMFWVYFTGVVEIAGAVDLMDPQTRPYAAWALILFLIVVFPANYHAAKNEIPFNGVRPLSALQRGLVQVAFIAALYTGAIGW